MEASGDSPGVCEGFEKDAFTQRRGAEAPRGGVRRVSRESARPSIAVPGMGKIAVFSIRGGAWCVGDHRSFLFSPQDHALSIPHSRISFSARAAEVQFKAAGNLSRRLSNFRLRLCRFFETEPLTVNPSECSSSTCFLFALLGCFYIELCIVCSISSLHTSERFSSSLISRNALSLF